MTVMRRNSGVKSKAYYLSITKRMRTQLNVEAGDILEVKIKKLIKT